MTTLRDDVARALGGTHLDFQEETLSMNATRDDMARLADAAIEVVLERAAQVADTVAGESDELAVLYTARDIATDIRALKEPT